MTETEGLIPRPTDVIGNLEYEIDRGGNSATINAMIAARDEIARLKLNKAFWMEASNTNLDMYNEAIARAERAEREKAEAVAAEREQCATIAKVAWLHCPYGEIADADVMNQLCEHIESAIRARTGSAP